MTYKWIRNSNFSKREISKLSLIFISEMQFQEFSMKFHNSWNIIYFSFCYKNLAENWRERHFQKKRVFHNITFLLAMSKFFLSNVFFSSFSLFHRPYCEIYILFLCFHFIFYKMLFQYKVTRDEKIIIIMVIQVIRKWHI